MAAGSPKRPRTLKGDRVEVGKRRKRSRKRSRIVHNLVNLCGHDGLMAPLNSTVEQPCTTHQWVALATHDMSPIERSILLWRPCGHSPFTESLLLPITVASGLSLLAVASVPARLWWVRRGDALQPSIHAIGALLACLRDSACASCLSFFYFLFRRCSLQLRSFR